MTKIAVQPLYMRDSIVRFVLDRATNKAADFEAAVSSATFTPSTTVATVKGLTPSSVHSAASAPTWTLDLAFYQDWENPESLANFLFDHQGETIPTLVEPISGGVGFGADVLIVPGSIGGAVDTHGSSTVSLGVQGQPTRKRPVPAPAPAKA